MPPPEGLPRQRHRLRHRHRGGRVQCQGPHHPLQGELEKRHASNLLNLNYRAEKKSLQILLSSTQAGPGRKVKQEQEEISRNHVPRLFLGSVQSEHEGMKDLFWHYVAYKKEQNAPL